MHNFLKTGVRTRMIRIPGAATRTMMLGLSAVLLATPSLYAQEQSAVTDVVVAKAELPDSPGFSSSVTAAAPAAASFGAEPATMPQVAGRYDKVILPGQTAPRLSVHDKVGLGVRDAVSPFSALGWVISAGYEQVTNSSPNFPQTGKGFAQRLGSAAARDASETIFDESILAPVLHEDPRYYKMGDGHNFFKRATYAATRTIITKTDGGRTTINFAEIGGDLGGSALTRLYYPPANQSASEILKTWGGSIGGDALSYLVSEFLSDTLQIVHLKKTAQ